jgi:O-succinylbenzoic acid--CoA ligase
MIILNQDRLVPFKETIAYAKQQLKNNQVYVLSSNDHVDHISAYVAWKEVGGNIFIKSPMLPIEQSKILDETIKNINVKNSISFHTSGTTGLPKLITHTEKQFQQVIKMATNAMGWNKNSKFLNFIPAQTSGFWNLVIPPLVKHDSTLVLGSKETLIDDFKKDVNLIHLVPALIDQLRIRNVEVDLSKFDKVCTGASQVLKRHAEWCFNNKAKIFNHMYGMTEICSPILCKEAIDIDDDVEYMRLTPLSDTEFKIEETCLYVKGESLYEGADEWFQTNDLWEQKSDMIKFIGRTDDIVKVNGFQCSLLLLENTIEEKTNLGDTISVVRNSLGSDWVELFYTNANAVIDKKHLNSILEPILYKHNIPLKYTYIEQIPRNIYGKKTRYILSENR